MKGSTAKRKGAAKKKKVVVKKKAIKPVEKGQAEGSEAELGARLRDAEEDKAEAKGIADDKAHHDIEIARRD